MKAQGWWLLIALVAIAFVAMQPRVPDPFASGRHPSSLFTEPSAMIALEQRGFALTEVVGSKTYNAIVEILEADLAELAARPGIGDDVAMNHAFNARWLRDPEAHFELVGLVPRLDRAFAEPGTCGELRRIYRLALTRKGRPTTRLPMTLSVLTFPRGACTSLATELVNRARLSKLFAGAPERIEVNLQNLHGPATPQDNEDHAEYLLRSFDVKADGSVLPHPLLSTPREDVDKNELTELLRRHFDDIDRGTLVLPAKFLALRAISVSPRGLARERNRVFSTLFGSDAETRFAGLPYDTAKIAKSPAMLLQRLDQGTCQGCHQSRAVAGFHLLGEERDDRTFNALRVGISNQLAAELPWRERMIEALAAGRTFDVPRPFVESDHHPDALRVGDACEGATVITNLGPAGDHLSPHVAEDCPGNGYCLGNGLGFPGGMCTDSCTEAGAVKGETICADIPASGYEAICFPTPLPIETCLETHRNRLRVRACDEDHPCREDYACARVPGPRGACVPPYFVFQARVDGPRADR